MSIRIGNNCGNCEKFTENNQCAVHKVEVLTNYTCDSFEMKRSLKNSTNCATCVRYLKTSCANPQKAAPTMLCAQWAPLTASA